MHSLQSEELRRLLKALDLSQRAAAKELGVSERTMRYWCAGEEFPPMVLMALKYMLLQQAHADLLRGC